MYFILQETSYVDSPGGGDAASSDMDNSDEDPDSEGKGEYMKLETIEKHFNSLKERKEEMEIHKKSEGETSSERSQHFSGRSEDERNPLPDSQLVESAPGNKGNAKSDEMPAQREEITEQQKHKVLLVSFCYYEFLQ